MVSPHLIIRFFSIMQSPELTPRLSVPFVSDVNIRGT